MRAVVLVLLLAWPAASQPRTPLTLLWVKGGSSPAVGPSDRAARFVSPGMHATVQATGIPLLPTPRSLRPFDAQLPVEFDGVVAYYRIFPTAGLGEAPRPELVVAMPVYTISQVSDRCFPSSLAPECITTTLLVQVPYFEREEVRDGLMRRHDVILRLGESSSNPLVVVPVFLLPRIEKGIFRPAESYGGDLSWGYIPTVRTDSGSYLPGSRLTIFASGLGVTDPPAPLGGVPDANVAHRPVAKFLLRYTWVVDGEAPPEADAVARSGVIEPDIHLVNQSTGAFYFGAAGSHQVQFTMPPVPPGTAKCNIANSFYNLILILGPDPAANRFSYPNEYRSDGIHLCVGPLV